MKKPSESLTNRWNTPLGNYACALPAVEAATETKIEDVRSTVEKDHTTGLLLSTNTRRLQEYYCQRHTDRI